MGVDRDGAFAEYVCIPQSNVIIIDESLPEDVVSFFDAFGNATHTALMWDMVGEDVLITGAGPIGIIAVGICKYAGARRVVITDINDYRLDLARKMGADAAVNVKNEDLPTVMHKQGLVEGFDIGLEMSGSGAGLQQMISVMRNGGNISLLGYMVQGGLDLTPVITHRFHYTRFEEGFAAMNSGKSGKVILDWSK